LNPALDLLAREAMVFRPEGHLQLDRGGEELCFKVLEDQSDKTRHLRNAMSGDFLSSYQDAALIFPAEEFGDKGIQTAAESGLTRSPVSHDRQKGPVFHLPLEVPQGRLFVSRIGEGEVFD
jgi:hypothetical protein